jgi:hypothetical protein
MRIATRTGTIMSARHDATAPEAILTLAEEEYRYGLGTLRLRVERITLLRSEPGWALVGGVRIDHRGTACEHRDVCVSVHTLRQHRVDLPAAADPALLHEESAGDTPDPQPGPR